MLKGVVPERFLQLAVCGKDAILLQQGLSKISQEVTALILAIKDIICAS